MPRQSLANCDSNVELHFTKERPFLIFCFVFTRTPWSIKNIKNQDYMEYQPKKKNVSRGAETIRSDQHYVAYIGKAQLIKHV